MNDFVMWLGSTVLGSVAATGLAKLWLQTRLQESIKAEYAKELAGHKKKLDVAQENALETLRNANTVQLESQRADLARENERIRVTFTRMHEKRATAIEKTYACIRAVSKLVARYLVQTYPLTQQEKQQDLLAAIKAYDDCLNANEIYLTDDLELQLASLDQKMRMIATEYDMLQMSTEDGVNKWLTLLESVNSEIPNAFAALKRDMRTALGDDRVLENRVD